MKRVKIKEWLEALIEASAIAIILYFLFWPILIDGSSMENTFETGDRVMVSRIAAYMNFLDRGDIILCKINYKHKEKTAIKRLIGLPGDHIEIKNGKVYINDTELDEPYLKSETTGDKEIFLTDSQYYIMGDNRAESLDSRITGPITYDDIEAKVIIRWYPFNKITSY